MPAFIKSEKDEKVWSRAKSLVHKQYPDISEDSDNFWKLANSVYHKIRNSAGVHKAASENPSPIDHVVGGLRNWSNRLSPARVAAYLRSWRSRVKPADIPGIPKANPGLHPMSRYYNFADRAARDPDTIHWSNTESLPRARRASLWDGKYKCNAFVQQAAAAAFGNSNILQHPRLGRTFTAGEVHRGLASGSPFSVGGGYDLHPISAEEAAMLPGSIVTSENYNSTDATGHIGITPGFGARKAISAASSDRAQGVSYNDWGFRKGDKNLYGMLIPEGEDSAAFKRRQLSFANKIKRVPRDRKSDYFRSVR